MAKLCLSNLKDENGKPCGIDRQGLGGTPLMIAIQQCNCELIEILTKVAANLQATDKKDETIFHHAAPKFRKSHWNDMKG